MRMVYDNTPKGVLNKVNSILIMNKVQGFSFNVRLIHIHI